MPSDMNDRNRLLRIDNERIHRDIALVRRMLFVDGVNITSAAIDTFLASKSLVSTQVRILLICSIPILTSYKSAFSLRLFVHDFNFYQMFVPDLMHEFELGVWKAIFVHLMRILHAYGNETISILNSRSVVLYFDLKTNTFSRYRHVPPFGCSTIRKFHNNASAMKKLAARDFEDLLQVTIMIIPIFSMF